MTAGPISEHGARVAAGRIGCTVVEYRQHEAAGEHWCPIGKHWVARDVFTLTNPRIGRGGYCHDCKRNGNDSRRDLIHFSLTPEGAVVATSAATCAQNATAVPSGHIYRPVEYPRPMQAARLERMRELLGVPVYGVERVEVSA